VENTYEYKSITSKKRFPHINYNHTIDNSSNKRICTYVCVIQLEYSFVVAHYTEFNSRKFCVTALTSKCDCELIATFVILGSTADKTNWFSWEINNESQWQSGKVSRLRSSSRTRSDRLTCENCAVAKRLSSSRHTESILSMSIFYAIENFILYTLNSQYSIPPVSTLIHWSSGRFMTNRRRKKNERVPHGIIDLRMINDLIAFQLSLISFVT